MFLRKNKLKLSIIVIFYEMRREARRTLHSLSDSYQQGVDGECWEVVAIDNASPEPLNSKEVEEFGNNFRYYHYQTVSASPVEAINFGVSKALSDNVAICIDGARMLSPGVIRLTLECLEKFENPFVCTMGWHIGPKMQNYSMLEGYDQGVEDKLLRETNWRENGYRLFEVSSLAASAKDGFFSVINESNFCSLRKSTFLENGGFDERFNEPGGGLVNLDFYKRISESHDVQTIHLLGEGTFHQFHGGVATNVPMEDHQYHSYLEHYRSIHGTKLDPPVVEPIFYGHMPPEAKRFK